MRARFEACDYNGNDDDNDDNDDDADNDHPTPTLPLIFYYKSINLLLVYLSINHLDLNSQFSTIYHALPTSNRS